MRDLLLCHLYLDLVVRSSDCGHHAGWPNVAMVFNSSTKLSMTTNSLSSTKQSDLLLINKVSPCLKYDTTTLQMPMHLLLVQAKIVHLLLSVHDYYNR